MTDLATRTWTPTAQELADEHEWITEEIGRVGAETLRDLARAAASVRANAYAPYSEFHVGAALLAASEETYASTNAEVVSYSETDHAEQSAVTKAISEGEVTTSGRRFIVALAHASSGNSGPCGRCRQVIAEHCDNALIVKADPEGEIVFITSLQALLPRAFTPTVLGIE